MKLSNINPYIVFLPFFLIYCIISILEIGHINDGDSLRYQYYATNLLRGFFSGSEMVDIWNGPMFPITLMPIFLLKLPIWTGVILQSFFIYLSVVFLFKSTKMYVSTKSALIVSVFSACLPTHHFFTRCLISEALAYTLVSLLLYYVLVAFKTQQTFYKIIAGVICAALILTKVIFAYVFVVLLLLFIIFLMLKKDARTGVVIILTAFVCCIPWLSYTYSKTDRFFYWASSGGENLYLLSVPYDDFNVAFQRCKNQESFNWDWVVRPNMKTPNYDLYFPEDLKNDAIIADKLSMIESCDYLTKRAKEMILENPVCYIKNVLCNIRYLFYALPINRTSAIICCMILLPIALCFIVSILLAFLKKVKINLAILFLLLLIFIYLSGSVLLIALWRQFYIIIPILLFWIVFVYESIFQKNKNMKV